MSQIDSRAGISKNLGSLTKATETWGLLAAFSLFPGSSSCTLSQHVDRLSCSDIRNISFDPDLESKASFLYDHSYKMSDRQTGILKEFFSGARKGSITVEIVPEGEELPKQPCAFPFAARYFKPPVIIEPQYLDLLANDFAPILVHGRIKRICISCCVSPEMQKKMVADVIEFRDQERNYVSLDNRFPGTMLLEICPGLNFSRQFGLENEMSEVVLDLSPLGLEKLRGFLFMRLEKPLMFIGDGTWCGVYSNMEHELARKCFEPYSEAIWQAIVESERFFGQTPGTGIMQVYIINDRYQNAYFWPENEYAIVFTDEELKVGEANPSLSGEYLNALMARIAMHEVVHKYDILMGLSAGKFKLWFEAMSETPGFDRFCSLLDEKSFLKAGEIGHSRDNSKEFLASLINGFLAVETSRWEDIMEEHDEEFRDTYYQAIMVLQTSLAMSVNFGNLLADAPIVERVCEIERWLHFRQGP